MSQNLETSLDLSLAASGLEQLDQLNAEIKAKRILGDDASPDGLAYSLMHGRHGEQIDGISRFVPGQDASYNVDILNTYASGQPMARKILSTASPAELHVVLDMPERINHLTGQYNANHIGNFMLALCGRVATETGTDVSVYHNNGDQAGLLYKGQADDLYAAYAHINESDRRFEQEAQQADLSSMLKLAQQNIDNDNEAVVVVSDFLGGYDRQTGSFDWEAPIHQIQDAMGDRLWATKVSSPSQTEAVMTSGNSLNINAIHALNRDFAPIAAAKQVRIADQLEELRSVDINTFRQLNQAHPVRVMVDFILGDTVKH